MTGWRQTVLPPDGRAVLVELLRPPPGAELARGIATTFTLDLASALAAPLSFASHRLGSAKDPEAIMQAVTMAADRLDIFCQAGQLNVPGKPFRSDGLPGEDGASGQVTSCRRPVPPQDLAAGVQRRNRDVVPVPVRQPQPHERPQLGCRGPP